MEKNLEIKVTRIPKIELGEIEIKVKRIPKVELGVLVKTKKNPIEETEFIKECITQSK